MRFFEIFYNFGKFWQFLQWLEIFETLITILTIEKLNSLQSLLPNNQEWHWTAFAILAMFWRYLDILDIFGYFWKFLLCSMKVLMFEVIILTFASLFAQKLKFSAISSPNNLYCNTCNSTPYILFLVYMVYDIYYMTYTICWRL